LRISEAVAGQGVDVAEDIAEFVVEEGALDAARQRVANVADLLAHLVEDVRHVAGGRAVLDEEHHGRFAGPREARNAVDERRFLQFLLDLVGHLLFDLARRGTRPQGPDDHDLEGEGRIFRLAQAAVGDDAH